MLVAVLFLFKELTNAHWSGKIFTSLGFDSNPKQDPYIPQTQGKLLAYKLLVVKPRNATPKYR